jgi:hypothetical protein
MNKLMILIGTLTIVVLSTACTSGEEDTGVSAGAEGAAAEETSAEEAPAEEAPAEEAPAEEAPAEADGVPTETAPMALNEGASEIPATINVPVGSTTFNDTPTTIRVEWADGSEFGVQVKQGNQYNTNLAETASSLRENNYGVTNVVVEETETHLLWTASSDGNEPSYKFKLLVELAGATWVCTQGNWGGWTRAEVDAQIATCRTLAAI